MRIMPSVIVFTVDPIKVRLVQPSTVEGRVEHHIAKPWAVLTPEPRNMAVCPHCLPVSHCLPPLPFP